MDREEGGAIWGRRVSKGLSKTVAWSRALKVVESEHAGEGPSWGQT